MPLKNFFKGNRNNTGSALFLSVESKIEKVKIEAVKQSGWDNAKRVGRFNGDKIVVFINPTEIAQWIYMIDNKLGHSREKKNFWFHTYNGSSTQILFEKWMTETNIHRGYSLTLFKSTAEGVKTSVRVSFSFADVTLVTKYLDFSLTRIFTAIHSEDKKKAEEFFKQKEREERQAQKAEELLVDDNPQGEEQESTASSEEGFWA